MGNLQLILQERLPAKHRSHLLVTLPLGILPAIQILQGAGILIVSAQSRDEVLTNLGKNLLLFVAHLERVWINILKGQRR